MAWMKLAKSGRRHIATRAVLFIKEILDAAARSAESIKSKYRVALNLRKASLSFKTEPCRTIIIDFSLKHRFDPRPSGERVYVFWFFPSLVRNIS
jgi:hypothetical protein